MYSSEDFESGWLPPLDVQVRMEDQTQTSVGEGKRLIRYKFYQKPMANVKVAEAASAHPTNQKFATPSQQVKTSMLNCDLSTSMEVRIEILNKFVKSLLTSGYKRTMVGKIIRDGVVLYLQDLARHQ